MQIAVLQDRARTVFSLRGDLDAETGPGVYLMFQRELHRGQRQFAFDLDGVALVDSAGLGVLVRCFRDARLKGGSVSLERVPRPIERLLEFTRLNTIFLVATAHADQRAA